jgi:hypothetical protein
MSQLCDSIQCRLTARTAGSAKGEILALRLGKKQTGQVKNTKTVNKTGHNNKLQTVTERTGPTLYHPWAVID